MSKAVQKNEKHQWDIERPKLDNARKLRGIYFTDLDDGEHKETIKNTVTLRMIPTYFQVWETLCCDMSCTSAVLSSVFFCCAVFTLATLYFDDGMGLPLETLLGSH